MREFLGYDGKVEARARLEQSKIIHKTKGHKYSEVESGRLWLNGRLQQVYWNDIYLRWSIFFAALPFKIVWDPARSIGPRTIWCLEIIGLYKSLGIILEKKIETEFERVDYFECKIRPTEGCLFNGVEPQTIIPQ